MILKIKVSTQSDQISVGVFYTILEMMFLIAIASIVKLLSPETPILIILFFRYLFCLPLLILGGALKRGNLLLKIQNKKLLLLRIVIGLSGLSCYFMAISSIGIGKTLALGQLITIFITILAPFLLAERIGINRWFAVFCGLIGTLIIIKPGAEGWFNIGIIWGLMSAFFSALLNILLRQLGESEEPISTALWYNLSGTLLFSSVVYFSDVNFPNTVSTFYILMACGFLSSIQQFLLAYSRTKAPASLLAPLQYLSVPVAVIIAIFFFNEPIGINFAVGSLIIIISAYSITMREKSF